MLKASFALPFMTETFVADTADLVALTADITSNFVANNRVGANEVAAVIQSVHGALTSLGAPREAPAPERPEPAVPIRRSVQSDHIVDLFTGAKLKTLKRRLMVAHNMTPAQYRTYWGLPDNYPMVAPAYSESRKALAKAIGLGRTAGAKVVKAVEAAAETVVEAVTPAKPARAARKPKADAPAAPKPPAKPRARKAPAKD